MNDSIHPCRTSVACCALAACIALAGPSCFGVEIADVSPADTLLYVEVSGPAELWASLQKTELREAVRASFLTELFLNFVSATADLLCNSLTDKPLGEVADGYGLSAGLIFSPPDPAEPSPKPEVVVLLRPSVRAAELQELMGGRVEQTLKARFPEVQITAGRVGGHRVTHIAFSRKRVWTLAFPDGLVAYGRRRAVEWMLSGTQRLAGMENYRLARHNIQIPAGPHVFCYAEVTEAAGQGQLLFGPGAVMAAVLEIDGRLVRDRILISGNLKPPAVGVPQACTIGSAFPAGPWLVNQVSFDSGAEMMKQFPLIDAGRAAAQAAARAFTGTGYLALTGDADSLYAIYAAEVAERSAAEAWLAALGFERQDDAWRGPGSMALLKKGHLYMGRTRGMLSLIRQLSSTTASSSFKNAPGYGERLTMVPPRSRAYSAMAPEFLMTAGCDEEFRQFEPVFRKLSVSLASAEKTDTGIEIRSVSPCGYGIWLVSLNLSAAGM